MTAMPTTKNKRRFLRFSLRSFLLFVLALCVALGWKVERARKQKRAVAALTELGARVLYDYHYSDTSTKLREARRPPWLLSMFGEDMFCEVVEVRLSHVPELKNDDLVHLRKLPHLKTLFLCSGRVTPDGLVHLRGLRELEDLTIGIQISDDDLHHLARLKSLRELYILGPRPGGYSVRTRAPPNAPAKLYNAKDYDSLVTDEGIAELASELRNCQRISY